jgi:hypothetical protein
MSVWLPSDSNGGAGFIREFGIGKQLWIDFLSGRILWNNKKLDS